MREAVTPRSALVVGGGVIGLTIALRLQEAGLRVRLADPDPRPRGASWGNAGHIAVEQVEPLASPRLVRSAWARLYPRGALSLPWRDVATWAPFALRLLAASKPARFDAGRRALSALLAEAMPAWRRLARDVDAGELLREDGHFIVWESAATAVAGRAHWLSADTGTASVRDVTANELASLATLSKAAVAGAVRVGGSGQIADTQLLAERLDQHFAALGGERIVAPVELGLVAGRAHAVVAGGRIEADLIVVAAGAASADLLRSIGIALPLIAERGYHIQTDRHGWPTTMPPVVYEDRSIIVTGFRSGLRVAGFVEFGRRGSPPDQRKWEHLRRHVAALGLAFDLPGNEWMGARPTLPDYLPVIAETPGVPNLLHAFGHQHLGLTLAPITAEIVTDLALARKPAIDLTPFRLTRYAPTWSL